MVFINNFNNSRELSDIKSLFDNYGGTNIDFLLNDSKQGTTNWSVPKGVVPGDVVVFMCAKSARNNLGLATSHIPSNYSQTFRSFVDQQKVLYKKYSGFLLGCGVVASSPSYDAEMNRWFADINHLTLFANPVHMDDFRSFISISMTNSITYLKDDQWERLKWVINQKNPGFFKNSVAPDIEILEREFNESVQKEEKKPLSQLKKEANKKAAASAVSVVQTKVYHRDATIAAYVKQRAGGYCQLCGSKAPFNDQNGTPYLECHHIIWLSQGGMDSADNCVAVCPNCHRKMHILNDAKDVTSLLSKIK